MQKLSATRLPWPADWSAVFGRKAPLILEIGFGRGHFLFHLARTNPGCNIVGLEISNECLVGAERKLGRGEAPNARVVHARAETALHHLFVPASLQQVHINFPDPWFKTRHSRRRLMQRDTVDTLTSRLAHGGLLYLATDIVEYAEMSAALLENTPGLSNLLPASWASAMPGRTITKYERTAQREGRACYYFAYRRNSRTAPDIPVQKELPMPHMVLTGVPDAADIQSRFAPLHLAEDETVVRVLACFRDERALLFEVYAKEPTIDQHCAIMLTPRPDGDATLLLSPLGHPRPTAAIHRAVRLIGDWIVGLSPGAHVVESKTATA